MLIITTLIFLFACLIYCIYQLFRNNEVFKIRRNWIRENDDRWYEFTYHEMLYENSFYGLKWPRDKNYKKNNLTPNNNEHSESN